MLIATMASPPSCCWGRSFGRPGGDAKGHDVRNLPHMFERVRGEKIDDGAVLFFAGKKS